MSLSESHQPSEAFIRALTESQAAIRGYCQASLGNADEAKEAQQRTSIVLWRKCGPEGNLQKHMKGIEERYHKQLASTPLSKLKEICDLIEKEFPIGQEGSSATTLLWQNSAPRLRPLRAILPLPGNKYHNYHFWVSRQQRRTTSEACRRLKQEGRQSKNSAPRCITRTFLVSWQNSPTSRELKPHGKS